MPLDQKVLPSDSFFLPALVHDIMAGSTLADGRPVVSDDFVLFRSTDDPIIDPLNDLKKDPIKITPPLLLFTLLLALEVVLIYLGCVRKIRWTKKALGCYEYTLVLLNFLFLTSLSSSARMIGAGKVTSERKLIFSVFHSMR